MDNPFFLPEETIRPLDGRARSRASECPALGFKGVGNADTLFTRGRPMGSGGRVSPSPQDLDHHFFSDAGRKGILAKTMGGLLKADPPSASTGDPGEGGRQGFKGGDLRQQILPVPCRTPRQSGSQNARPAGNRGEREGGKPSPYYQGSRPW